MPTPQYTALANVTLSSTASAVTFSSISQVYKDLVIVASLKHTSSGDYTLLRVNGDGGSNYLTQSMRGNGSAVTGQIGTDGATYPFYGLQENNSEFIQMRIDMMDYRATDKHKNFLMRGDAAGIATIASVARWASTSAINTVTLSNATSTFIAGSTFALYGVN